MDRQHIASGYNSYSVCHEVRSIGKHYEIQVDELISKLVTRQPFHIDDVTEVIDKILDERQRFPELSQQLSSALLHTAMLCKSKVVLRLATDSNNKLRNIGEPTIMFRNNWQISQSVSR